MIDLSHLTEEEQERIVSVLKRDAELKKADEERIKRLQKAVRDKVKLKYLTGEWFYQTKSHRHRDRIHGSDIIRAAMRQRKPMTILEITQLWAEKPSFVNSEIQDIFVPAELSGLIDEPSGQPTEKRASASLSPDVQKDGVMFPLQSPAKMRENPFDSVFSDSEASEGPGEQFIHWEAEQILGSEEELLPPSKSHIGSLAKINSEDTGTLEAVLPETAPLLKKRTTAYPPLDSLSDKDESFPKWSSLTVQQGAISVTPKGILKHSSSCSSADFPVLRVDRDDGGCSEPPEVQKAQQPKRNDRPVQRSESLHSLDRKQVRFSTTVSMSKMEEGSTWLADGEFEERDLLDVQCKTFTDEEDGACRLGIGRFIGESNNDLTHSGAACEFQNEGGDPSPNKTVAESVPGMVTTSPSSESQHCRLGSKWEEEDTGEAKSSGEGTVRRGRDVGLPQSPGGQHDAESSSQSEDQKGKPVHAMIQGRGLSSRPAEQSHGLAEEQGCPIAKVLEGFSWGCDGSNQYDSHQKGAQEAVEEFGILEDAALDDKPIDFSGTNSVKAESQKPGREPSEKKVKSPARSDTEAQTLYGDVSHTEQMTDGPTLRKYPVFHYLNTDASSQRESCITASENKLSPGTEGKLMSQREAEDKTAPLSHPVVGDAQLAMKRKYVYEEISPQRLANLKLFWEKGICGSKILISKTSKYSETNKTMKEFVDRSEADQKWSKSGVDLCKVGKELPFWTGETSAPETMKNVYGHYNLHFKARNESEPHGHEVGVKRSPLDSANSITITEQSGHSLFQKEAYPNPEKDSSHLEESSTYFESRNMRTNQNEEDIYVAKPIISEEVPEGLKTNIQTGHQGQESGSKHDSLAACGQTGKQQDDRAGKISHLKSKGKSGPKIIVGKQKGSLETKVNQIPEPTSSCAEKELAISRSDLRSVGIELDRSSLPSIKEQPETELENQTANNAQYGHIDDCRGTVPSVKAELLSTDGVPQHSKSTYQETLVMQQACQFLVREPSPDCPPQIPPRCPIKSKTETCSSKSHSVDVCPPIRELIEKEQKQIPPIWQKKVHSPRRIAWDSGVTKMAIETKDVHHPSTQTQEASEQPRNRRASEGHGTDCTPDSPRSNIPKTWSNSLASSDCCDESQSPVMALKQISARPVAESKNLEDISSQQTISPVSTCPSSSFSEREQMKKRCASMPAFLHGEKGGRDSDSDSESSFTIGGRKSSASTNFSTSSGMASMSSASSSLMSIYSLEFENVEVKGTIQFALSYVQKLGELHVFVVRCRDLAIADSKKNRSDPYVKSYLLPDKERLGKKKTTVKKKTINPIYNEILRYKIDVETLKSQVLNLSVWHHNSFGRNSFLGEVDFELSEWDLRNTHMNDFRLKSKSTSGLEPTDDRGEIRLALRFLQQSSHGKRAPKTGLVQIFVKECKNLPLIRGAAIDPFVKCYVLPDTNRKSRQKSRVLRRTANPVFNHTMVYDGFKAEDLQEACVEITVWDHDRLNNHFLGGVRLSLGTGRSHGTVVDWMDSNTAEAMLWEQMMDSHNEWVEDVLPLRMLMMAHSMSK